MQLETEGAGRDRETQRPRRKEGGLCPHTQPFCRVPRKKLKSICETIGEKGLLEEFPKTHKYDPIQKYHFSDFSVTYKPWM